MVKHIIALCCLLSFCLVATAQQTLNIHTTTKGVVSFTFASKPEVTFPSATQMTVKSETMTVEFPFSEVEKITFSDAADGVGALIVRDGADRVSIYDLSGKLVHQAKAQQGRVTVDLSTLRPGVYVVKDGKRTYKIRK